MYGIRMYQTYRQFSVFTTSVGLAALAPINSRRGCAAWVTVLRLGRPYFPERTGTGGFFFWTRFENLVAKRRKINDRVVPIL